MPTNLPIYRSFTPLTDEVMKKQPSGRIEGTLTLVGDPMGGIESWVLEERGGNGEIFYTHPTLFSYAADHCPAVHHAYEVVVSLEDELLKLRFLTTNFGPVCTDTPTFESEPTLLTTVPLRLVFRLYDMTKHDLATCFIPRCQGARSRPLETSRSAIVLTNDRHIEVICRRCVGEIPSDWKVLLRGWELPPRAPVQVWNCLSTRISK